MAPTEHPPLDIVMASHIVREMIRFPDRELGPVLGGPTAYCSVIAAKLGARVGIVTPVGDDMPESLLVPFTEVGVDTRGLHKVGPYSTNSLLLYDAAGNKQILYPRRAPAIQLRDFPPDYLGGRAMHIAPMDYDLDLTTLGALRKQVRLLSVDLGGYGGAHSSGHPTAEEQRDPRKLRELVSLFDIVRASLEDCRHLLGENAGPASAIPRQFVAWGSRVGIVTLGAQGAAIASANREFTVPSFPGKVVDTTGAGDSFSAGFLVEYLRTEDAETSARFACAVAQHVIGGTGGVIARRMPTRADVERLLQGHFS
jgi:2-dehydro-3-deoxygluconokinase